MITSKTILVEGGEQLRHALRILKQSTSVYLDARGTDIGFLDGQLSLICVGALQLETLQVFAFDVSPATQSREPNSENKLPAALEPLFELLSSDKTTKIMWDGRRDYVEIRDRFGVSVECVLDLQIVELVSRFGVRTENKTEHFDRVARRFGYRFPSKNRSLVREIHVVTSIRDFLSQNGMDTSLEDGTGELKQLYKESGREIWMTRPLTKPLLDDINRGMSILATLHSYVNDKEWIPSDSIEGLQEQSRRYLLSQWERGREDREDPFRSNVILPMEVLSAPPLESDQKSRTWCAGCGRMLGVDSFMHSPKEVQPPQRRIHCKSCYAWGCFHRKESIRERCQVWQLL